MDKSRPRPLTLKPLYIWQQKLVIKVNDTPNVQRLFFRSEKNKNGSIFRIFSMVDQVIIPSHLLVENYVIPAIHPTRNHSALRNHILRHLLWKWAPCKLFLFPKKEI